MSGTCEPWPMVFIHIMNTYGSCLSVSAYEGSYFVFLLSLAQWILLAERGRMHSVTPSFYIIHALLLTVSLSEPVCLDRSTNSFQHCTPNVASHKGPSTSAQ